MEAAVSVKIIRNLDAVKNVRNKDKRSMGLKLVAYRGVSEGGGLKREIYKSFCRLD